MNWWWMDSGTFLVDWCKRHWDYLCQIDGLLLFHDSVRFVSFRSNSRISSKVKVCSSSKSCYVLMYTRCLFGTWSFFYVVTFIGLTNLDDFWWTILWHFRMVLSLLYTLSLFSVVKVCYLEELLSPLSLMSICSELFLVIPESSYLMFADDGCQKPRTMFNIE